MLLCCVLEGLLRYTTYENGDGRNCPSVFLDIKKSSFIICENKKLMNYMVYRRIFSEEALCNGEWLIGEW